MTTSFSTTKPRFTHPLATAEVPGTWQGTVTLTRAADRFGKEHVFVLEGKGEILLLLTPTEAADLAEASLEVSGMACSTDHARFLGPAVRDALDRAGVTRQRAASETGISLLRIRRFLRGELPVTLQEHKALSALSGVSAR